ncbi:hypothetical protein [Chengkuizengella marina]|nr:hypothetical protein [Chengkuizengella marina]
MSAAIVLVLFILLVIILIAVSSPYRFNVFRTQSSDDDLPGL